MNLRQRIFWSITGTVSAIFGAGVLAALILGAVLPGTIGGVGLVCLGILLLAGAASAFGTGWLLSRRIDEALQGFIHAVPRAASASPETPLPDASRRDLAELADAFDEMTTHVREHWSQMQDERDRLRTVLNSMVEGMIAVDAQQRIMFVNSAASKLFKLRDPHDVGRPLWELVRHPRLQQWVGQALERGVPVGGEIELHDPQSRVLIVNIARFPVQPQPGAVIVMADVTELRRLERVRQEFVANASHELKTPLASIKACVETLLDGASADPEYLEKFLRTIDDQTDRLDALIKDMLTLARVETESMTREPRPVVVSRTIDSCLQRHRQSADRKELKLIVKEGDPELRVLADDEALEQIIDNLIDNAIKYTNSGGTVTLAWRAEGSDGVIEVSDTGIGIPSAQVARIFERFYRVDRHRARDIGGTGLGLAIVKHLVQSVGGSIAVNSRLHQGSTFTVRLPLDMRTAPSARAEETDVVSR